MPLTYPESKNPRARQSPVQPRRQIVRLRDALRGLGYPFDVMVMATERFEETKDGIGGLAYPANKYGQVLYDAAG